MPAKRKKGDPWFRKETGTYYLTVRGQQHNLGTADLHEAKRKAAELRRRLDAPGEQAHGVSVLWVLDQHLQWLEANRSQATFQSNLAYIRGPVEGSKRFVGFRETISTNLTTDQLKVFHVTQWLARNPHWGQASKRNAMLAVKAAMSWAVEQGLIERHGLTGLELPATPRRETYLTAEQVDAILAATDEAFGRLVLFCWLTGCRPQEARLIERRHIIADGTAVYIPIAEAKGNRRPRRFSIPEPIRESVKSLVECFGDGPIFRNQRGRPWTKNAVVCRFRRLRAKLGLEHATAYLLRHGHATQFTLSGGDLVKLQHRLGHSSVTTTQRYQHLPEDWGD